MSRKSSPLLLAATLLVGLLIGLNLTAYRGRPLAAVPAPQVPASEAPARTESGVYAELDRQFALFEHVNRTFELVAKAVSPSVVHIVAHKVANEDRHPREFEETGSGVIVRAEGQPGLYVLTNNHVVATAAAEDVQIYLHDGRALKPEWLKADSRADVAVMKLGREDLPAARLGDSDRVAVGSWVMAIGSPFGLSYSVSQGIISGRGRHDTDLAEAGVENQDFLQTDAAINPGNSGGPLVNMKGEVIGLNIAILSNGGGNEGVGFTIPINLARWIMNSLIASGRVSRGALGVRLGLEFDHDTAVALGLDRPRGAMVDTVDKASPAALSGLRGGDVILRFNGSDVADLNHLINLVSMAPIGRAAEIVLWRDRKEFVVKVTIGDKDQAVAALPPRPSRPLPTPNGLLPAQPRGRLGDLGRARPRAGDARLGDRTAARPAREPRRRRRDEGRARQPAGGVFQAARRDPHDRRPTDPLGRRGRQGPRRGRAAGSPGDRPAPAARRCPAVAEGPPALSAAGALSTALARLVAGHSLTEEESFLAVGEIMAGGVPDATLAAFLTGLHFKGETSAELAGAVRAVRERMEPWDDGTAASRRPWIDTCGTGGDGANTVNISTASAIVVAAAGQAVAKHGNRSASGNSGSAEVLNEFGVVVDAPSDRTRRCLSELGLTFLFAPSFHPGLKNAAGVRRQLPFRTLFNLVGPLANPARPEFQIIGVSGERQQTLIAEAIVRLGTTTRAAVVRGEDGLDEVTLGGATEVVWIEAGDVSTRRWTPEEFGLPSVSAAELRVDGPRRSAELLRSFFEGEDGPVCWSVLANAAAALLVAGRANSLREGVDLASEAVDTGQALSLLERWAALSQGDGA